MRITFLKEMIFLDYGVRDQIRQAMQETYVELDFKNIEYIDSMGVDLIIRLCKEVVERNRGHVKALNMSPTIKDILDICGILSFMEV